MHSSALTIISPTLNEVNNIRQLISQLKSVMPDAQIIIADDGSTDGTIELVRDLSATVPGLSLCDRSSEPVHGITASFRSALEQVETKYVLLIDADLQHPPAVAKQLLQQIITLDADFIFGARAPYQENQGAHRIMMTKIATFAARMYLKVIKDISLSDPMSGLFVCRTEVAKFISRTSDKRFIQEGYKILFDLLKAAPAGLKTGQVVYQFEFRTEGKSKLSPKHAFYFLRSLIS